MPQGNYRMRSTDLIKSSSFFIDLSAMYVKIAEMSGKIADHEKLLFTVLNSINAILYRITFNTSKIMIEKNAVQQNFI
jgi:hypothetical protein